MKTISLRIGNTVRINLFWLYEVFIILLPILDNYLLLPIRFSIIAFLFGSILLFYQLFSGALTIKVRAIAYIVYAFLITLGMTAYYKMGSIGYSLPRIGTLILSFLNYYIFAYKIWDFEKGFKLYRKICDICSIIVILQLLFGIMGKGFSVMIPGLKTTGDFEFTNGYIEAQISTNRFSSFFLEPAHQTQYCLPCIAILLMNDIEKTFRFKKGVISAIVITAGLMATTSMLGILGVAIVWTYYLFCLIRTGRIKGISRLLVLAPIAIVGIIVLMQQEVIRIQFLKKITSFNGGNVVEGSSMYVRIFYGWDCFKDLSLFHKLFGYGYYNSSVYLVLSGIGTKYTEAESAGYMSGLATTFCELGIIGATLNLSILVFPALKCKNRIARGIILSWLIIMLTSANFDRTSSLLAATLMLSLVYTLKNPEKMILQELKNE